MKMEAVLLRAIGLSLVLCPQSRDIKRTRPEEFKLHDLRFSWRFHLSPAFFRAKYFPPLSSPPQIHVEYRIHVHHDLRRDRIERGGGGAKLAAFGI